MKKQSTDDYQQRQLNTIQEIDQHLQQNEHNLQTIENFLQNKRMQLTELQEYLINQFKEMQVWKDKKEKIITLLAHPIRSLLADIKAFMIHLSKDYQVVFSALTQEISNQFKIKLIEKERQIQQKGNKIQEQNKIIEKMKCEIERNINNHSHSQIQPHNQNNINAFTNTNANTHTNSPAGKTHSSFMGLRQLSREVSRKKTAESNNNGNDKILSKSSFLDFHVTRLKSKEKQKNNLSRSPKADRSNDKGLRSFKHYCEQENKLVKTPTARKIMFEVHRNLKEDLENNTKVQIEHKKYVKQKIECLKNKNSGIFNEYRPMKLERKF